MEKIGRIFNQAAGFLLSPFGVKLPESDYARLQRLYARISKFPEGRELLKVKNELGIKVSFSRRLGNDAGGKTSPLTGNIRLDAREQDEAALIAYLAHEIRHAWQRSILKIKWTTQLQNPRIVADYIRMIEGDAYSFEYSFGDALYKSEETTGEKITNLAKTRMEDFIEKQQELANYDDRALKMASSFSKVSGKDLKSLSASSRFLAFVVNPDEAFSPKLRLENLRKICVTGFDLDGENYLAPFDAKTLQHYLRKNATEDFKALNKKSALALSSLYKAFKSARAGEKHKTAKKLWYKLSRQA